MNNPHTHNKPEIIPVEGITIDYESERIYRYRKINEYPNQKTFDRVSNWYHYNPVIEIKEKLTCL